MIRRLVSSTSLSRGVEVASEMNMLPTAGVRLNEVQHGSSIRLAGIPPTNYVHVVRQVTAAYAEPDAHKWEITAGNESLLCNIMFLGGRRQLARVRSG